MTETTTNTLLAAIHEQLRIANLIALASLDLDARELLGAANSWPALDALTQPVEVEYFDLQGADVELIHAVRSKIAEALGFPGKEVRADD